MLAYEEARRHGQAGQAGLDRQDWPSARGHFDAALAILAPGVAAGDPVWREAVATAYAKRGEAGLGEGRPDLARTDLEIALGGYQALGLHDGPYVSAALSSLGLAYARLGDPDRAVAHLQQAVALKRRENVLSLSAGLNNLALALQAAGDPDGADQALAEAINLPGLDDDRRARLHQERAFHLMSRGDFGSALVLLGRRLGEIERMEQAGWLPEPSLERAICLSNIGACYAELRDPVQAQRHYRESVAARRVRTPDSLTLASALSNLATVLDQPGDEEERRQVLEEAAWLGERHGPHSALLAVVRGNLVGLLVEEGDPGAAVALAERTIADAPAANRELATTCLAAAVAYQDLGEQPAAEEMARRAYNLCAQVSPWLADLRPILTVLGRFAQERGDLDAAAQYYDRAIAVAERFRVGADREPGRERSFGLAKDAYHGRIEVSYQRRRPGDGRAAFHAAEAFRARTLADLLATGRPDPPVPADRLHRRLGAIYRMLDDPGPTMDANRIADLEAERDELEQAAEWSRLRLLDEQPEAADGIPPVPCTIPDVQDRLAPDTTFALYEVTGNHVYLWTITSDDFSFRRLRPTAAELAAAVSEVLANCRDGHSFWSPAAALDSLGEWLIGPLTPIAGRLIVCADSTLAYLPFEALPGLPRGCVVSYTPSATTLVRFGDRPRSEPVREFAGFAVEHTPRLAALPDAVDEVHNAASWFPPGRSVCRSGGGVTVRAIREYAAGSRYVHFAAHGVILDDQPLHSGLPLLDGFLPAYEMFSLDLCADVVVVSACDSAVGADHPGEGIVGLSRALLAAGARAVLLSRWSVRDRETMWLMTEFYRALAAGYPPADALAFAVDEARRTHADEFAHPREWAAFMLIDTQAA